MLFKFLPEDRVDVVKNLSIRFSPISSLNDPFEQMPLPYIDLHAAQLKAIEDIEISMMEFWSQTAIKDKTTENKEILDNGTVELIQNVLCTLSSDNVAVELNNLFGDT
ncbi:hypothetical protein P0F33_002945, partial [Vibrio metschnikovii]|nr:hypothetical protein [Vibrio metschnikovii]